MNRPYLFANNSDENFSPMRRAPVFEEENALPRSELHFSIDHRYGFTRSRQCHPDMRWHIIAVFGTVCEVIGIFWHQVIEKLFQITTHNQINIFHNKKTTTNI